MNPKQRLLVLISGQDSNLQAILDACASGELYAEVVAVISAQASTSVLARARHAGVPTHVQTKAKGQERREFDAELADLAMSYRPDWVVLTGWTHILTSAYLDRFPNRVINLHPSLPGTFPGTHAVERAFYAYCRGEIKRTGVMIHLVSDQEVDSGPVLAQQAVPISPEDTIESLEARVHIVERRLLIATLKQLTHDQLLPDFQNPLSAMED